MFKRLAAILAGAALVVGMVAGSVFATEIKDNGYELSLQEIIDSMTTAPTAGVSSVDASGAVNDALFYDQYWNITASGGSVSTFIISITAGNDIFGIYQGSTLIPIFNGTSASPGDQVTVSILANGTVKLNGVAAGTFVGNTFGYYISSGQNTWFSDSSKNVDSQADHMVALQGNGSDYIQIPGYFSGIWTKNEYILGFEDAVGLGDADYQDLVVMVESVAPVPEPGTMVLLGAGMLGMAIFGKRRMNRES